AEAIALGQRLFLLDAGRIAARGAPLDVLARARTWPAARLDGVRNSFPAAVDGHADGEGETRVRIADGPTLVIPYIDRPAGTPLTVGVRADDILLSRGPIEGLSARNVIPGTVERVVPHGHEAEVVIRTGGIAWIVSVVPPAVTALGLSP